MGVSITKRSHPSHVVMSAEAYQQLMTLAELEDRLLGQQAQSALNQSQMVGVEEFTLAMQRLANGEA
ncbi:prevent-host-death protein [Aliterella atlantica]|uniref:prevent-host-death protein n=1 Tax=Aliterella atlantica TaxID=1827278 RepID=UPI00118495B1|nr:prevent-host-death protein [Aliterella atlantica]